MSGSCYSASYMSQIRDEKRFTISEVAAAWLAWANDTAEHYAAIHCPRVSEQCQLDPRFAASRHTTAPISHAAARKYT